ncbi:hypothetical protein FO519_010485, partial [Halicephalobus sp. NKZ332]
MYIYRVENSNILKRSLRTSEGEEINSVEVARTKLPIRHVSARSKLIDIITWGKNVDDSYSKESYKDLPKCDVPDDGTPCDDDQSTAVELQTISTVKKTTEI